jgi:radical SAM protein with 4Fe4S-binding SPASM domain
MVNSNTFCIMPHTSLAIQNEGTISPCNLTKHSYITDTGYKTIDKASITEFWNSHSRQEFILKLDNGIKDSACDVCWQKEAIGEVSVRQHFNSAFENKNTNKPSVIILKPGNSCNSACRTCVPETSTAWYSDAHKLQLVKNPNLKFRDYVQGFENIKNSFKPNNPNFWPALQDWYGNLQFMDIYGGEPWLINGLWHSLQWAVDHDFAKNIKLQLHTNCSVWNEKYLILLSKFKSVRIGLSIDSHIKDEFEYIRHKSDYDLVFDNTHKFIEYIKQHDNMSCYISCTASVLNIWNLAQIVTNLEKKFAIDVGFTNFVYDPEIYDMRHLPREVKRIILNRLPERFKPVTDFMNSPIKSCEIYWPKFCLETERLDKIRNQNFSLTFPEWYEILKPYWDYKKRHPDWYGTV